MTLAKLIAKATKMAKRFTSAEIPLKLNGIDVDIEFEDIEDKDNGYVINVSIK